MGHSGVVQMIKDTPHSAIDSWRGGGGRPGVGWGRATRRKYIRQSKQRLRFGVGQFLGGHVLHAAVLEVLHQTVR